MSTTNQQGADNLSHALAALDPGECNFCGDDEACGAPDCGRLPITTTPEIEWTARFNNGNGGASIAIDGRSVFVTGEQARELAVALVGPMRVDARASIVAFLTAEAKRFDDEAARATSPWVKAEVPERLTIQAGLLRTLAAQIARGDDRLGGAK